MVTGYGPAQFHGDSGYGRVSETVWNDSVRHQGRKGWFQVGGTSLR